MFSKNIYTWEGLENLMVKGDPWKRAWDHSCLANFYFQGTNCRAGWRDLPLLSSCCQPQESYQRDLHGDSQSELWRCVLLTATMPWRVWSKSFSSFSQCGSREQVQVKQNKTHKKTSFFIFQGITHPLQEHNRGSCEDAEHQAPNQLADQKRCFLAWQSWH